MFVHWLLPHPPFIRNYKTGDWQYFDENGDRNNYYGNLKALDIAFGEIRAKMKQAGLWQNSAVLLTSDHGYTLPHWREKVPKADRRVPFLLKLPGSQGSFRSDKPFKMTSLPALLDALTARKIAAPNDIEQFLTSPTYYH